MPLVQLDTYYNASEAGIARSVLEAAGVLALLFDTGAGAFAGSTGIRLMVDDADESVARALLDDRPA